MTALFLAVASLLFSPQAAPAQDSKTGVTEKEAEDCGRFLEKEIRQGKADSLRKRFDVELHTNAAVKGLGLKEAALRKWSGSMANEVIPGERFVPATGADFRFLRARMVNGAARILFRIVRDQEIGYFEFFLARASNGTIRIVDLFNYSIGEELSAATRRWGLAMVDVDIDLVGTLKGMDLLVAENFMRIAQLSMDAVQGDARQALEIYEILPELLKEQPFIQVCRLRGAIRLGEAECAKVQEDIDKRNMTGTIPSMVALRANQLRRRHDPALEDINRLEKSLGGDPFLNYLRGEIQLTLKRMTEATGLARLAAKDCAYLPHARWLLVRVLVQAKTFGEAADLLGPFEKDFGVIAPEFFEAAEFSEFVKSPEYSDWKKTRTPSK